MTTRTHFQRGWLTTKERASGTVWYFNFREYQSTGKARQRTVIVGPVSRFKTESEAWIEVDSKRLGINAQAIEATPPGLMTIKLLAEHYQLEELGAHTEEGKASSTKDGYDCYIRNHIVPRWGDCLLSEVKAVAVEKWLRDLTSKPRKDGDAVRSLAKGTKAKIRNIMHGLYEHAMRHEFIDRNPITQVRQSGKRERIPEVLTVEEFQTLLERLRPRERAMVILDAPSGLRRGELFGLKWGDIDWQGKQANVTRSIVHNTKRDRIGICKTEASRKPVPLDQWMLDELDTWWRLAEYQDDGDWIFASPAKDGKFPFWPQTILKRCIRPVAKAAGITKRIGWHTFRHTYATLLGANEENVKVVQELLRHANSKITLDTYMQAQSPEKRAAQGKVVTMFRKAARA